MSEHCDSVYYIDHDIIGIGIVSGSGQVFVISVNISGRSLTRSTDTNLRQKKIIYL